MYVDARQTLCPPLRDVDGSWPSLPCSSPVHAESDLRKPGGLQGLLVPPKAKQLPVSRLRQQQQRTAPLGRVGGKRPLLFSAARPYLGARVVWSSSLAALTIIDG